MACIMDDPFASGKPPNGATTPSALRVRFGFGLRRGDLRPVRVAIRLQKGLTRRLSRFAPARGLSARHFARQRQRLVATGDCAVQECGANAHQRSPDGRAVHAEIHQIVAAHRHAPRTVFLRPACNPAPGRRFGAHVQRVQVLVGQRRQQGIDRATAASPAQCRQHLIARLGKCHQPSCDVTPHRKAPQRATQASGAGLRGPYPAPCIPLPVPRRVDRARASPTLGVG